MYQLRSKGQDLDFEYSIESAITRAKRYLKTHSVIDIFDGSRLVWTSQKAQLPVYKQ